MAFSCSLRALLIALFASSVPGQVDSAPTRVAEDFTQITSWKEVAVITAMAWSPRKDFLACYLGSGAIAIRDTKSWEAVHALAGPKGEVGSLAFSPDGKWLASGGDGVIKVWKVGGEWKLAQSIDLQSAGESGDEASIYEVRALSFSTDSKWLVLGGDSPTLEMFDTRKWRRRVLLHDDTDGRSGSNDYVTSVAWCKQLRGPISVGLRPRIQMWKPRRKKWRTTSVVPAESSTGDHEGSSIAVSRDSRYAVVGQAQRNGRLIVLDIKKDREIHNLAIRAGYIPQVGILPDGESAVGASLDLVHFDISSGETKRTMNLPSMTLALAVAPNGRSVAVSGEDQTVRLYSLREDDSRK